MHGFSNNGKILEPTMHLKQTFQLPLSKGSKHAPLKPRTLKFFVKKPKIARKSEIKEQCERGGSSYTGRTQKNHKQL